MTEGHYREGSREIHGWRSWMMIFSYAARRPDSRRGRNNALDSRKDAAKYGRACNPRATTALRTTVIKEGSGYLYRSRSGPGARTITLSFLVLASIYPSKSFSSFSMRERISAWLRSIAFHVACHDWSGLLLTDFSMRFNRCSTLLIRPLTDLRRFRISRTSVAN